jgi:hypothetical protein
VVWRIDECFRVGRHRIAALEKERAIVMRVRDRDARLSVEPRLLGVGTAISVFLVLLLIKLAAFFVVHPHMIHLQSAPDPVEARSAVTATR